jgi:hypothetical protein
MGNSAPVTGILTGIPGILKAAFRYKLTENATPSHIEKR